MQIKIVTDSTCDLPRDIVEKHHITVIPLYINIGSKGYLDGVELSREEFYKNLPNYSPHPTTATPGADAFRNTYDRLAREGATDILSIHISPSLSATLNVAQVAAQETKNVNVVTFDSRQLSLGTGFLVQSAAAASQAGASLQEIIFLLEEQIQRTHVFAALDTLKYLRRSGRMNGAIAGLGSLLQIKPILKMFNGEPTSERVRTRERANQRILNLFREYAPYEKVAIVHSNAPEDASSLYNQVSHLLPENNIPIVEITPVIGAHIGPGASGFAVVSKK